ncbi:BMP family lipoprotein [Deinococcus hopiensis]|uniref:Basic membrane protein A n=1 Tax=Deinococcus hopiensis KR-140 TaxID=695939 RepID=A0A1W1UAZ9_9DEIO|nr:BMP family ABC transporter substrate-binding protein [Deinococcus hopiensis]SMB78212.1 basic membrane protein A [Deinococcus hopiensis KR-140]
MNSIARIARVSSLLSLAFLTGMTSAAAPTVNITLVYDAAGPFDKATNEAATTGLERAVREHGLPYTTATATDTADLLRQLRVAAKSGSSLIIATGRDSAEALSSVAKEFPSVRFVGVDTLPKGTNTVGLRFREQEGAFLAGYLAANVSSTHVLGVVASANDAVARKYRAGFKAGVVFACPDCRVLVTEVPAQSDVVVVSNFAKKQYAQGADIVLAAVGANNRSVVTAATAVQCLREATLPKGVTFRDDQYAKVPRSDPYKADCKGNTRPVFAIATDSSNLDSAGDSDVDRKTLNHTLTSIVKRTDNAVFTLVTEVAQGKPWRTGERGFGLQNDGVELSLGDFNTALITKELLAKVKKVEKLILGGTVKVPVQ